MKYFLAAATVVAVASAQAGLPSCASSCLDFNGINCQQGDFDCFCNDDVFIDRISCCISQNCDSSDQNAALGVAQGLCGDAPLPSSAGCSGSAASSTSASVTGEMSIMPTGTGSSTSDAGTTTTTDPAVLNPNASQASVAAASETGAAWANKPAAGAGLLAVLAAFL